MPACQVAGVHRDCVKGNVRPERVRCQARACGGSCRGTCVPGSSSRIKAQWRWKADTDCARGIAECVRIGGVRGKAGQIGCHSRGGQQREWSERGNRLQAVRWLREEVHAVAVLATTAASASVWGHVLTTAQGVVAVHVCKDRGGWRSGLVGALGLMGYMTRQSASRGWTQT